jgi:hypothetical protein
LPHSVLRDWIALFATSLSALFAGLIWWIARKSLSPRYELRVVNVFDKNTIALAVEIDNRGNQRIVVDGMSVALPLAILGNAATSHFGETAGMSDLANAKHFTQVAARREIEPGKQKGWTLVLYSEDEFRSRKTVSISIHILVSWPAIRHKKKVLTAILPESTSIKTL